MKQIFNTWKQSSLIKRITTGVLVGGLLGAFFPKLPGIDLIGQLFVGILKSIAPILVFTLVTNALSQHKKGQQSNMKIIVVLYLIGTYSGALISVITNLLFPITMNLGNGVAQTTNSAPNGIGQVMSNLLLNIVENPIKSLSEANYIGILAWAIIFGIGLRETSKHTKDLLQAMADVTSQVVTWIIDLAPFGIMGLVFSTISKQGIEVLSTYGLLLAVLIGNMLVVALIINPLIAFIVMKKNPYPLVLRCLHESGTTAFFTRSSASNIPVNMKLAQDLGLDYDTYSVSIPLGSTVNMAGAAVTIATLTLAAVNTLGITVDLGTGLILSLIAAVSASGASGVAGGSLLLIPVACSLFGIPNDTAMQVVSVGFIIGVLQDSFETALNSSTDVLFTAVAHFNSWEKKKTKEQI